MGKSKVIGIKAVRAFWIIAGAGRTGEWEEEREKNKYIHSMYFFTISSNPFT